MKIMNFILLFLFLQIYSIAQNSVQISISATVISESPVQIITISNMVIDVNDIIENEIYISPINSPDAGLFKLIGNPNSQIRINYDKNITVYSLDNEGYVSISYELSYYIDQIQNVSYSFSQEEQVLNFDESGIYYIWVGGNINLNNAVSGSYSSKFTIEIEYI